MKLVNLTVVLAMAALTLAHEEEDMPMPMLTNHPANPGLEMTMNMLEPVPHIMHHAHGVPILQTNLDPLEREWWEKYDPQTYFNVELTHRAALWMHVIVGLVTIVFVYPIALVLKNVGLKWYMPILTLHTGMVMLSLFNYSIFINLVPDLYPGNAYGPMLWVLFFFCIAHYVSAVIYFACKYLTGQGGDYHSVEDEEGMPLHTLDHDDRHLEGSSELSLFELTELQMKVFSVGSANPFAKVYRLPVFQRISSLLFVVSLVVFNFLNWGNFFYFLIILPVAVAVMGEFGKGKAVFNLLAHFIKGGVFFAYGIMTLARYMGGFTSKGWAWNHKFIRRIASKADAYQPEGTFTMEFLESALITFYGCTNIFMEHLAGAGGAWTAKDLQHALIAFIYIGCGFGGLICESKLLLWRRQKANSDAATYEDANCADANAIKASPGYLPNPFPVLTIFWTGVLMLKHAQASQLSTDIHTLWGNLFMYGCFFRGATYLLMMLLPKNTLLVKPTRPFTELVTAFCLMLGGLIFMESTDPLILAFEWHGWTEMFILNVLLGIVTLLMAWQMAVFAFKDWLLARQCRAVRA